MTQSRAWLPNPIGGLTWYGVNDTYTTCYMPLYCGIDALPKALSSGSLNNFSWDSAWWVFNVVSNYSHTKYSQMVPEVQAAQKDIESELLGLQPAVEKTALELARTNPELMTRYLTDYSVSHVEQTTARWRRWPSISSPSTATATCMTARASGRRSDIPTPGSGGWSTSGPTNSASLRKSRPKRTDRTA